MGFRPLPDDGTALCVYDTRYYLPRVGHTIKYQPGLELVTKQFLYQSAYQDFVRDHGFERVANAFLVPTSGNSSHELARVSFPGAISSLGLPLVDHAHMQELPTSEILELHLAE